MTDSKTRSKSKAEQQFEEASRALDEMVALSQQMGLYDMEIPHLSPTKAAESDTSSDTITEQAATPHEKSDNKRSGKGDGK